MAQTIQQAIAAGAVTAGGTKITAPPNFQIDLPPAVPSTDNNPANSLLVPGPSGPIPLARQGGQSGMRQEDLDFSNTQNRKGMFDL